jgi:glycosyltransferase involved in cell wall biosynthesis
MVRQSGANTALARESQSRRRIRVGFDARWYNDSGVGSYVSGLLGAMAQSVGAIELLVYEDANNRVPLPEAAQVQRIAVKAAKYSAYGQIDLARRCREDRLDVFHSPFYVVPFFAPCPVVVTVHDLIPFLFPIYRWPKSAMVRSGYRMAARKADRIIADSNRTLQDIESVLGTVSERVSVVHIAAQECYSATGGPAELERLQQKYGVRLPYVMVSSARNWHTKNLETALQALQVARQQSGVDFHTVIYGPREGLDVAGGRERWRSLNLKPIGYVPSGDLAMLFRHASVFLLTSLYEGFGLPVLEAMSCGCAVVCSNGGALTEIAGSGAQVFQTMDAQGMGVAVNALLHDKANLNYWQRAALKRAREFSWAEAARETISVYHRTHSGVLSQSVVSGT